MQAQSATLETDISLRVIDHVPDEDVQCIAALVATVLSDTTSSEKFYECKDAEAQSLINLLQAVFFHSSTT